MCYFLRKMRHVLTLALMLASFSGCVSVPDTKGPVNVFVSANGIATYSAERFNVSQLATRLHKSDVDPSREIRVHMEELGNKQLMSKIAADLHQNRYIHIFFMDEPQGSAEITDEPGTRVESPALNRPPPRH